MFTGPLGHRTVPLLMPPMTGLSGLFANLYPKAIASGPQDSATTTAQ